MAGEPEIEPEAGTLESSIAHACSERIFVVEDEPAVRSIIVRTLERLGYSVQAAGDGSEALSMFLDGAVDELSLLVTDIVMPHLGGTELATRLRETLPDLRVLYVSGYADRYPEDIADSSRAVLLAKPFLPSDLAREVRTLLDHDRSAAE